MKLSDEIMDVRSIENVGGTIETLLTESFTVFGCLVTGDLILLSGYTSMTKHYWHIL